MSIFDIVRTPEPELTREEIQEQRVQSADVLMKEAGGLFDETVNKLSTAEAAVKYSIEECSEEIENLKKQVSIEEETVDRLSKRQKSISKVMNNVKSLFMFEDFEDENTTEG